MIQIHSWYVEFIAGRTILGETRYIYEVVSTQTTKKKFVEVFEEDHLKSVLFNLEH